MFLYKYPLSSFYFGFYYSTAIYTLSPIKIGLRDYLLEIFKVYWIATHPGSRCSSIGWGRRWRKGLPAEGGPGRWDEPHDDPGTDTPGIILRKILGILGIILGIILGRGVTAATRTLSAEGGGLYINRYIHSLLEEDCWLCEFVQGTLILDLIWTVKIEMSIMSVINNEAKY